MKTVQASAWRFLDKQTGSIVYGLGSMPEAFAKRRFLAMNRLLEASDRGGELFAGDVVALPGTDVLYLAYLDGTLESRNGASLCIADILDYTVIGQQPCGWIND